MSARPHAIEIGPPAARDDDEQRLVERLRAGDEGAYGQLVERHHAQMIRLACQYVASRDLAEEVVQEAWLAAVTGMGRFERRSTVKTWLYRIVVNRAKTRAVRERRTLPFSCFGGGDGAGPSVPPERFQAEDARTPGAWVAPPRPWTKPEQRLLSLETRDHLKRTLERLAPQQQLVVTLHDVEGLSTPEVCEMLDITPGNARVLLHRARSRLRAELAGELEAATG